jgi:hypothetical protein
MARMATSNAAPATAAKYRELLESDGAGLRLLWTLRGFAGVEYLALMAAHRACATSCFRCSVRGEFRLRSILASFPPQNQWLRAIKVPAN